VALRGDWRRGDHGPLVAFLRPEEEEEGTSAGASTPVALLPRSRRGYDMVDAAGRRRPVDDTTARRFETDAYMLYRPLPQRPLGLRDLLANAFSGLRSDLALLAAVSLAGSLLALLPPLLTRRVVTASIPEASFTELRSIVAALVVAAVAAGLFQIVRGLALLRIQGKMEASLQAALWDRVLALPASFFRRFTVGDLETRVMGIDRIRDLLTVDVTTAILASTYALVSLAVLFYFSFPLALAALSLVALSLAATALIAALQLPHLRAYQQIRGKLASLVYALLSGINKLRVGAAEHRAFAAWAELFAVQKRHAVASQSLANLQAVVGAMQSVSTSIVLFALVGLSVRLDVGVGDFLAFSAALGQFQAAALTLFAIIPTVLDLAPIYERMRPLLDAAPETDKGQAEAGPLRGDLELRKVSFRYRDDGPWVLEDVSFRARSGEMVALVGPSGSGKTTCLRLLLGFEQPQSGCILVDGRDLASLDRRSVRRQMGVVLQDAQPLVGDILHNIVGSRNLPQEAAWKAARQVGLEEEIRALPMGMHTFIPQGGSTYSAGQLQRLLLARALVGEPRILLLDEATSALDNRTQDLVMKSLAALRITRIVIAHRLSTIADADRIYVFDRGRVVERGTFTELERNGGLFSRMIHRQVA
jgi:ATP-binding cassette subfamily C protein